MRTHQVAAKQVTNAQQAVAAQQTPVVAPQQPVAPAVAPQQAGVVAPQQPVAMVTPVVTVQPVAPQQSLRVTRLQRCVVAAAQRYAVAKTPVTRKHYLAVQQRCATAVNIATQQQYLHAVQQLAIAMGQPVPNTLSVRAVANQQQHAPSAISGPCATVRAFVHANPLLTRKQVQQHFAGTVNPATVSTQYQLAKNGKA